MLARDSICSREPSDRYPATDKPTLFSGQPRASGSPGRRIRDGGQSGAASRARVPPQRRRPRALRCSRSCAGAGVRRAVPDGLKPVPPGRPAAARTRAVEQRQPARRLNRAGEDARVLAGVGGRANRRPRFAKRHHPVLGRAAAPVCFLARIRVGGNPSGARRRVRRTPLFRAFAEMYLHRSEPQWQPSR